MNLMKNARSVVLLSLAVLGASTAQSLAATLDLHLNGVQPAVIVHASFNGGANYGDFYSGALAWNVTSSANPSYPINSSVKTFCIEAVQDVWIGQTYHYDFIPLGQAPKPYSGGNPAGGMGNVYYSDALTLSKETALRRLWGHTDTVGGLSLGQQALLGSNNDMSGAFQIAIWKIIYETSTAAFSSLTTGNVRITNFAVGSNVSNLVSTYLGYALSGSGTYQANGLSAITSPDFQDQIVFTPTAPSPSPVPLPPAALAGGVGLALVGLRQYRAKRAAQA